MDPSQHVQNTAPTSTVKDNSPPETKRFLEIIRDQLSQCQETHGVRLQGSSSFVTLVLTLVGVLVNSLQSVLGLMLALAPMTEVSLHVARFSLDRIIEISRCEDKIETFRKAVCFVTQISFILSVIAFVVTSIILPVGKMNLALFRTAAVWAMKKII